MNKLFSPPSFNINNINVPEEFDLSRELFFFDNPGKKWSNLILTIKCYKTRRIFLLESLEEYEQDRFEQSNSDYNNDSHESIDENIDIFENQNQPPDSPIVQLLMSAVTYEQC